jgi:hypothetical protein
MQAQKRSRILAYVAHKNALPPGTTMAELQSLEGLIEPIGWPRWQLTAAGWLELERLGQESLAS